MQPHLYTIGFILILAGIAAVVFYFTTERREVCADFKTQYEAQQVFEQYGGNNGRFHRLDGDNDGVACEKI